MATVSRLSVSLISQHCVSPQQFSLCSECNSVPVPDVYLLSTLLFETTSLRLCCKRRVECEFSREQDKCALWFAAGNAIHLSI